MWSICASERLRAGGQPCAVDGPDRYDGDIELPSQLVLLRRGSGGECHEFRKPRPAYSARPMRRSRPDNSARRVLAATGRVWVTVRELIVGRPEIPPESSN